MTGTSTAAPRVLVVEDEYLIRMLLEDMLDELGYGVAAAVGTISEARKIAADGEFSAAILDVNLDGQEIYPVADILARTEYALAGRFADIATVDEVVGAEVLTGS